MFLTTALRTPPSIVEWWWQMWYTSARVSVWSDIVVLPYLMIFQKCAPLEKSSNIYLCQKLGQKMKKRYPKPEIRMWLGYRFIHSLGLLCIWVAREPKIFVSCCFQFSFFREKLKSIYFDLIWVTLRVFSVDFPQIFPWFFTDFQQIFYVIAFFKKLGP